MKHLWILFFLLLTTCYLLFAQGKIQPEDPKWGASVIISYDPFSAMKQVADIWLKEEPENPMPHFYLAQACLIHEQDLETGERLAEKALNLFFHSKSRLYGDFSGRLADFFLPKTYLVLAKIARHRQNPGKALAMCRMAREMQTEFDEKPYLLEAGIWTDLGREDRAEGIYARAYEQGSKVAREKLAELYKAKNKTGDGFEGYLAGLLEKNDSGEKEKAPVFSARDLEDKSVDLASLQGKVVVLNFWFIGCAPCLVEIPGLNTLVEEYKDKEVEFLAIALDSKENLQRFLSEKPFHYRIIPNGSAIAEQYGVEGFPTHLIINPSGEVEARLTGGNAERHKDIQPLLDRFFMNR